MPTAELTHPARRLSDRRTNDPHVAPAGGECRRRELRFDAVGEADGSRSLFPVLRPCGGNAAAAARRAVIAFDARTSATTWILRQGLEHLGPVERRRIVDSWRTARIDEAPSLIADGGCDVRVRGASLTNAVRVALLEWLPLSRTDLAVYESGLFRDAPARSLTLLVRPPTIWPIDEAVIAARLVRPAPRFEPEQFAALERHARGRLGRIHLARLREVALRIEMQVPVEGLPGASVTVATGCAVIANDEEQCASTAAAQLARYAMSAVVARVGREAAPTMT